MHSRSVFVSRFTTYILLSAETVNPRYLNGLASSNSSLLFNAILLPIIIFARAFKTKNVGVKQQWRYYIPLLYTLLSNFSSILVLMQFSPVFVQNFGSAYLFFLWVTKLNKQTYFPFQMVLNANVFPICSLSNVQTTTLWGMILLFTFTEGYLPLKTKI